MMKIKNIAYGVSDFEKIRTRGNYFVDKTHLIPDLEQNDYVFFIRPRRFGKSLWLSVLETYYDISKKDQFETFFGDLWIGQNPTPEHNSYLVLEFNFSEVLADPEHVEDSFEDCCKIRLQGFCQQYQSLLPEGFKAQLEQHNTTTKRLSFLFETCRLHKLPLYLLIDEYDNFANTILSTAGHKAYHQLTHGEGFFRHFFSVLKAGTSRSGSGLQRLFITGVSPITMDDVTSGFNIGKNLTLDARFQEMAGFTEKEARDLVEYYQQAGVFQQDWTKTQTLLAQWYNGYRFSPHQTQSIYNTDMVLYFVQCSIQNGCPPDELIDQNIRIDYGKLRHLLLVNQHLNGNFDLLKQVIEQHEIISPVNSSFPLEHLKRPDNFISLLYYFGLLAMQGTERGWFRLSIPNQTVWHLMHGYMREAYQDTNTFQINALTLGRHLQAMAWDGDWEPFFDYLSEAIAQQTSIRDYLQKEKVVQGFLLAYLYLCDFFIATSEPEANKGFADVLLEPFLARYPKIPYGYLLELKYFKRNEMTEASKQKAIHDATHQLQQYLQDARVKSQGEGVRFQGIVLVYHGWELVHRSAINPGF